MLNGYTADAALIECIEKSPELYSLSLLDAAPHEGGEEEKRDGKRKGGDRSDAERVSAAERNAENMRRQIENLKKRTAGGGGNKTGQPGNKPPTGTGNGTRPTCAEGLCKDYNFKPTGCDRANCRFKHECCACGAAHPWRGNH